MDEGINSMVETIRQLEAENEKLKFRLSNVMLSLPSDEIADKAADWYRTDSGEYDAFKKGAAWMSMRLIDEERKLGNGA